MTGCCDPRGCDVVFGPGFARRRARRYRARGLDKPSRRVLDVVLAHGVQGASVLEVGGGVGEIQVELLRRGAARTTNLELSPGYEPEARRLLSESGVLDRADRRLGDVAVDPDVAPAADIVVLHRVVCCYPNYRPLLSAAAARARRLLVFSHPPSHAITSAVVAAENAVLALMRREYRAFAHPAGDMYAVVAEQGLERTSIAAGPVWHVAAFERPRAADG